MLLHPRLAAKLLGDDGGRVMIAIASQILDGDFRAGKAVLYQALDLFGLHRHKNNPSTFETRRPGSGAFGRHYRTINPVRSMLLRKKLDAPLCFKAAL